MVAGSRSSYKNRMEYNRPQIIEVTMSLPNFDGWICPIPLQNDPTIVMGHGAGGQMMNDLIRHLFAAEFQNDLPSQLGDATILERLAISDWLSQKFWRRCENMNMEKTPPSSGALSMNIKAWSWQRPPLAARA